MFEILSHTSEILSHASEMPIEITTSKETLGSVQIAGREKRNWSLPKVALIQSLITVQGTVKICK